MVAVVTLDMFSGRPNPSWELSPAQIIALRDELATEREGSLLKPTTASAKLGYRGFHVESVREELPDHLTVGGGVIELSRHASSLIDPERRLEYFLLESGLQTLGKEFQDSVAQRLARAPMVRSMDVQIMSAPPYNPGRWNTDPVVQKNNNCYNYACDKVRSSFSQPGRGSGRQFSDFVCGDVSAASIRDGLKSVAGATGSPPPNCHYAALVVDPIGPYPDYHWYRFDSNGRWSHKPGQTPATDRDNSNLIILNPETADRGEYVNFCGYFEINITTVRLA
jgi:hypothetical protein